MSKFEVKYSCYISIVVDADDLDIANDRADRILLNMTGADFREECEWEGTEEMEEPDSLTTSYSETLDSHVEGA